MRLQLFAHGQVQRCPGLGHLRDFFSAFLAKGEVQGSLGRRLSSQCETRSFNC